MLSAEALDRGVGRVPLKGSLRGGHPLQLRKGLAGRSSIPPSARAAAALTSSSEARRGSEKRFDRLRSMSFPRTCPRPLRRSTVTWRSVDFTADRQDVDGAGIALLDADQGFRGAGAVRGRGSGREGP